MLIFDIMMCYKPKNIFIFAIICISVFAQEQSKEDVQFDIYSKEARNGLVNKGTKPESLLTQKSAKSVIKTENAKFSEEMETRPLEESTSVINAMLWNTKETKTKYVFGSFVNDGVYQLAYSITNPLQLLAFGAVNTFVSIKSYLGFNKNDILSLTSKQYNVIPEYLSEDEKKLISSAIQEIDLKVYYDDLAKNESYIQALGIQNAKTVADEILAAYDGTESIDEMLNKNEFFISAIEKGKFSEEKILKIKSGMATFIGDLLQIKLHGRYGAAFNEFMGEFHSSNNFIAAYNTFFKEAYDRHHLEARDYTLMMKFFLNSIYKKRIENSEEKYRYEISTSITSLYQDEDYIKKQYDANFAKIMETVNVADAESKIIYSAVQDANRPDTLNHILKKGVLIGRLARYSVIICSSIYTGLATVAGAAVLAGNYVSTAVIANLQTQKINFEKFIDRIYGDTRKTAPDSKTYTEEHCSTTTTKIQNIIQKFQNTRAFRDIKKSISDMQNAQTQLKNSRTIIAIKPSVMKDIADGLPGALTQQENINDIISKYKKSIAMNLGELSHNLDTRMEKIKKLFNKYIDTILYFATSIETFKPIDENAKIQYINEYVDNSAKVFKTAVYNNFYETFKHEYIATTTSFEEYFFDFWDNNIEDFIETMYFERFNTNISYAEIKQLRNKYKGAKPEDHVGDTEYLKLQDFEKNVFILRNECIEYAKTEMFDETKTERQNRFIDIITSRKKSDEQNGESLSEQLGKDKLQELRILNDRISHPAMTW